MHPVWQQGQDKSGPTVGKIEIWKAENRKQVCPPRRALYLGKNFGQVGTMAKPKRWIDKFFTYFTVAVVVGIWFGLAVWLVVDWGGFWEMIGRMEIQIKVIPVMLLF